MIDQKTSLILGATKGLGEQIALLCRARGDLTIEVGSSARDWVEGKIITRECDLNDLQSVQRLVNFIEDFDPPISHFFWVAGRLLKGQLEAQTQEDILSTTDVNYRNVLPIVSSVWSRMHYGQNQPSHFVVIASSSGVKPRADEAVYVATKHAQVGLTRSLGLENKNNSVKVTLVLPGGMQTQLWDRNPTDDYQTFLDPVMVAQRIFDVIGNQAELYYELEIPRGSL